MEKRKRPSRHFNPLLVLLGMSKTSPKARSFLTIQSYALMQIPASIGGRILLQEHVFVDQW